MSATPPPLHAPRSWTAMQVDSHLHTLKILFYVLGSFELVLAAFLLLVTVAGYVSEPPGSGPDAAPWLLFILMGVGAGLYAVLGGLSLKAAGCIGKRRQHRLCLVVAGLACLTGALGVALAAYALWALLRTEVAASFLDSARKVVA
ncbi:hypothetical protein EDF77_0872 [Stenotrophomonas maltophilia]|jgi:hypothetical protein|uniref:hypothetical protein n=1 Tax=Stenotrophomonas chelatiphaga TaxID=517011 RepID=UPI000FA5E6E7|nr:hypothetical protein [Stenotrophomonas chelatiphaga]MCS4231919.1 putative membrane protein [Stenotrophomonas chelatiphaga]ROQ45974.1 hypothetical protein EDF77_0872 [Stenotrophomonas maltophilia]